jgi:hypothetical protein
VFLKTSIAGEALERGGRNSLSMSNTTKVTVYPFATNESYAVMGLCLITGKDCVPNFF